MSHSRNDATNGLTLNLPTWTKWWAPVSASKWRMGFNSAFKGLMFVIIVYIYIYTVLMLPLVLSIAAKANYTHRIYVYSLYYCMLKQVLEMTSERFKNI